MNWKISLAPRRIFNAIVILASVGLLVVLAFSLSALFASRTQQTLQPVSQPQPLISQQISATPPPIVSNQVDPTTEWQIFYFDNYSTKVALASQLSMKYPPDWQLRFLPRKPGGKPVLPQFRKEFSSYNLYRIYPRIHENKDRLSLQDWVTQNVVDKVDIQDKDSINRSIISIDDRQLETVSGAHFPAAVDSLHAYIDMNNDNYIVVELSLWPYRDEPFATKIDEEAQSILYHMAASVRLSPR
jgi:hypothetical protein